MHTAFWAVVRGGGDDLRERDDLENPYVAGRITLEWIFRKYNVGSGLDWRSLGLL